MLKWLARWPTRLLLKQWAREKRIVRHSPVVRAVGGSVAPATAPASSEPPLPRASRANLEKQTETTGQAPKIGHRTSDRWSVAAWVILTECSFVHSRNTQHRRQGYAMNIEFISSSTPVWASRILQYTIANQPSQLRFPQNTPQHVQSELGVVAWSSLSGGDKDKVFERSWTGGAAKGRSVDPIHASNGWRMASKRRPRLARTVLWSCCTSGASKHPRSHPS